MFEYINIEDARELMYQKQDALTEYDLDSITLADVQPVKHGKWIIGDLIFDEAFRNYTCSVCHTSEIWAWGYPYCPHCGAKMDLKD